MGWRSWAASQQQDPQFPPTAAAGMTMHAATEGGLWLGGYMGNGCTVAAHLSGGRGRCWGRSGQQLQPRALSCMQHGVGLVSWEWQIPVYQQCNRDRHL